MLDVQLSVSGLLVDALGAATLAKELARRGGQSTSDAKADAARRNGAKGGRPASRKRSVAAGSSLSAKQPASLHKSSVQGNVVGKAVASSKQKKRKS
jgi:hypothetical protein